MPIVYAGGRYHVAVGSVGAAVLFLKYLALFGSCRLNTLTRCLSSLLVLWVSLHFRNRLALLRRGGLITLTSGVLLLLGQGLATAEVAEVVIAPIVFSFIKPLCRCLTLVFCNDGAACVRC